MKIGRLVSTHFIEFDALPEDSPSFEFRLEIVESDNAFAFKLYRRDMYRLQPFENKSSFSDDEIYVADYAVEDKSFATEQQVIDFVLLSLRRRFGLAEM